MIDPKTSIGMVTLNVADMTNMSQFYQQVIGLQVHSETAQMVTLGTSARPLVRLCHLEHGRSLSRTTGLYHLALLLPRRVDLANWFHHYSLLNGSYWQGASDHGVSNALYLSDPEKNGIEIYWDRPSTEWQVFSDQQIEMYTRPLDLRALLAEAEYSLWTSLPDQTVMGHIHLQVNDIAQAKKFYVEQMGFGLKSAMPSALFVAAGHYHHHIGLNTWNSAGAPPPPSDAYGLANYQLILPDASARDRLLSHLREANYPIDDTQPDPMLIDPSGNHLLLCLEN